MAALTVEANSTPDELEADPLADFVLVRTDQIDRTDRLRPIDDLWAEALGQVMLREGQRTPIEVCRLPGSTRWTLVSGGHRHAGAEMAGIAYLRAEIVSAGRDDRRMREVSENLWRRDLDPIDRAAFMAELVDIKRRAAGLDAAKREASVPKRWQRAISEEADTTLETISNVYGWSDELGAELGFTGRTIRNDLMLYRRLTPSVVELLRGVRHPVATNASQLRALAKLEPDEQTQVARILARADGVKTVAAAIAGLGSAKPPTDPEAKRLSAFLGAFGRMSLAEKKGALAHLAGMLPAEFALTDRGGATAPAGGAVLGKGAVDKIIAGLAFAECRHSLIEPGVESPARENWAEGERHIKAAVRVLNGARSAVQ